MSELQDLLRAQAEHKTHSGRPWVEWHTPLRLLAALVSEVGELAHLLRFEGDIERISRQDLRDEVADIGIFWLRLADELGVDGLSAVWEKMHVNERTK